MFESKKSRWTWAVWKKNLNKAITVVLVVLSLSLIFLVCVYSWNIILRSISMGSVFDLVRKVLKHSDNSLSGLNANHVQLIQITCIKAKSSRLPLQAQAQAQSLCCPFDFHSPHHPCVPSYTISILVVRTYLCLISSRKTSNRKTIVLSLFTSNQPLNIPTYSMSTCMLLCLLIRILILHKMMEVVVRVNQLYSIRMRYIIK